MGIHNGFLGKHTSLNAVYCTAGLAKPVCGNSPQVLVISTTGILAGVPELGAYPAPYTSSETGTYALEHGGTAYEFTNHPSAGSPRQARDGAGRRLGNVLAVVSDNKLGQDTDADLHAEYYNPETMMLTDYYPFGSPMVGRTWQSGGYRYGFNGMQKDNEVVGEANGYDFGARLYDGRVGRWWSVDPMWKKYPNQSSYMSFGDLPIYFIDPGGETLKVHTKHLAGSPEFIRLSAMLKIMAIFEPQKFATLNESPVEILVSEGEIGDEKTIGETRAAISKPIGIFVREFYSGTGAVEGVISEPDLQIGKRATSILETQPIEVKNNTIEVVIDFKKLKRKYFGSEFKREYVATGVHEIFGHTMIYIIDIETAYIDIYFQSLRVQTSKGAGHAQGDKGGEMSNKAESDFYEKYPSLKTMNEFEEIK